MDANTQETHDDQSEGAQPIPQIERTNTGDTERPSSAQRINTDEEPHLDEDAELQDEADWDPADPVEGFDWTDLEQRYHDAMGEADDDEQATMQDWSSLMDFFKIWAEAGHSHENERTFVRLRTRMAYVKHSEDEQEKTRKHYTQVVDAFQSALDLLQKAGVRS